MRLPLPSLTVASADAERLRPYSDLIADEMNVKSVRLTDDADQYGRVELAVNARVAGPRLGKDVQRVIKAVKAGNVTIDERDGVDVVSADGIELLEGEYTRKLVAVQPESTAELPAGAGLVVLDTSVTEELEAEGWAKDRIRELQEARRAAGLDVSDRIRVTLAVPDNHVEWARRHRDLIAGEVLAVELDLVAGHDGNAAGEWVALGDGVQATLAKATTAS